MLWLALASCSTAAAAAAVALALRLDPAERRALLVLCAAFAVSAVLSPNSYLHDHWEHFRNARAVLDHPERLLSLWDRPGFLLLYAAPAQLGLRAARLMSAVPAAIAVAGTMLAARGLGVPRPWLVGLMAGTQLDFFGEASSTMTELLFAAGLAVALWGWVTDRPWRAAAGLAFLALTRPEAPLYAFLGAGALLVRYRRAGPPALALGPLAAFLGVGAMVRGDALWFVHASAGDARLRLEARQLRESFFYRAWWESQPGVLWVLQAAGAVRACLPSGRRLAFLLAPLLVCWLLLTFLSIGRADWWRQSRYLVAMAPPLALLAGQGLAWLEERLPATAPLWSLLAAALAGGATWLDRSRLATAHPLPALIAFFAALALLAAVLFAARRRLPWTVSLGGLLLAPLVLAAPGSFARHRPSVGERLDAAAVRWLQALPVRPASVGWNTPALRQACEAEIADPCPLPLDPQATLDAPPGTILVRQEMASAPDPGPPPGWRAVWRAEDGDWAGPQIRPRWVGTRAVAWERVR